MIKSARRKQAEDLEASFHATLKHVPFPLRGIVKKALTRLSTSTAEIFKLAHQLGVDSSELDFLAPLPAERPA